MARTVWQPPGPNSWSGGVDDSRVPHPTDMRAGQPAEPPLMAFAWVRVDANLAANHKVLALLEQRGGDHALNVFIFSLGYCMNANNDGFVPKTAPGLFHGSKKDAALLVDVGLWHELPGGWQIHDWRDYQPSSEEAQKRSDKAKRAAAARWGDVKQASEDMLGAMPQALPDDVPSIAPPMPRTYGRNEQTNERLPRPRTTPQVPKRARGNRAEAQRELENLAQKQRGDAS